MDVFDRASTRTLLQELAEAEILAAGDDVKAFEIGDVISLVTGGVGCEPGDLACITSLTTSCVYFRTMLTGHRSRRARTNIRKLTPSPTAFASENITTSAQTNREPRITIHFA